MLGLTIMAFNLLHAGYDVLGAVAFTLAMAFKQMALYYSPAVFAYLFGKCIYLGEESGYVPRYLAAIPYSAELSHRQSLFFALSVIVLSTLGLVFGPFLRSPFPFVLMEPIRRIF